MIRCNSDYIGFCHSAKGRNKSQSVPFAEERKDPKTELTVDLVKIGKAFSQAPMSSDFMIAQVEACCCCESGARHTSQRVEE